MSTPIAIGVGGIRSADIAVPDHELALRFYSHILATGEEPLWNDDLTNNRGAPIIGIGARSVEYEVLPLQWMPHIQVADVAASVSNALDLGGNELMRGTDDEGRSQWAVLLDPNGAAFGIIPVDSSAASPPTDDTVPPEDAARTGSIAWADLTVPDASATRDFYQQVVGWPAEDVPIDDASGRYADYNLMGEDGNPVAGICHSRGQNEGLPPVWMIYLPVGDLAESICRVAEGGGTVVKATRGKDGKFEYAVVQDPLGACLALVRG